MGGGGGITFTNNMFWTKFTPKVGYYGTHAHMGETGIVNWSNNSYTDDGITRRAALKL